MDPVTVTTTLITLASFIKDLIEVGQSIKSSIEKVGENRRRIRELTNDVLRTLADLASLTRGQEDTFQAPALLSALANLKADMLYVLSISQNISPVRHPGFRRVSSQIKVWIKRDDLEKKIGRLKEHVNKCYLQFTVFSAARIERTTVRVEQTLIVNNVENQVKLRRLEGMMARVLLETQFGQNVVNKTMEIIASEGTHQSLESQYISAQTRSLMDSLQKCLTGGNLVLQEPLSDPNKPFQLVSLQSTPLNTLQQILGAVMKLSVRFQGQLQFQFALLASQESLDLWNHISESLPEVDNRIGQLLALIVHARNLSETGQRMTALSIAQNAAAISRPMADEVYSTSRIDSLSDEDQFKLVETRNALFILAKVLSSVEQHLESYTVFREGFRAVLRFTVSTCPPIATDIDSFLNQICKVAEEGTFSLGMLADCVILFRDLARMYPQASFQFLQLFYAYVYLSQHNTLPDSGSALEDLRLFIEPAKDHPAPKLDITMRVDFSTLGIVTEDAVRAYYTHPSHTFDLLMRNIFVTHFKQAVQVLQETVEELSLKSDIIPWALYTVVDIVPLVSKTESITLLQIMTKKIPHLGTILAHWRHDFRWLFDFILIPIFVHLWSAGLLDDALAEWDGVIAYFRSCSNADAEVNARQWQFQLSQPFVLCDMGKIPSAIAIIQQTDMILQDWVCSLLRCLIRTRILRRTGRNQEALQMLKRERTRYWPDEGQVFNPYLCFLPAELAAVWDIVGRPDIALKEAERAVATCRRKVDDTDVEAQKCTLVHALTTFSNSLAAVGRNDEALAVVQDAVAIYTQNAEDMWEGLVNLLTIRKEELGANAFHSLSLRLATFGRQKEALINANKATELYRELVALAPRHLPTLASSLRNLASILSNIGRGAEVLSACQEAVRIMRNVVDSEPYFFSILAETLDQLANYLKQKGDDGAAAAAAEGAEEARGRFADLPPQPDYLFEKVEMEWEDDEEADEGWETASEGDDSEYHDALDTATDVEVVVSETDLIIPECPPVSTSLAPTLEQALTDAVIPAKSSLAGIFCTPLEVRVNMNMSVRTTPMDISWWLLTGALFAALVWSRLA
ncbi:Tetratricopeptide repeat family [Mycena venus]|uniref:Tetratricopeptide repeat family n=1 Tax=Mycena venus TaxID=2733690 RepID=A0A8H7D3B4_9AGAR|nr:Tetratricopeptide repeat family [Mycena venus]